MGKALRLLAVSFPISWVPVAVNPDCIMNPSIPKYPWTPQ